MSLPQMRTLDSAIQEIQRTDPGTSLTRWALRSLVLSGKVPSVTVGAGGKRLINLEVLNDYLNGNLPEPSEPEQTGKIRRIG